MANSKRGSAVGSARSLDTPDIEDYDIDKVPLEQRKDAAKLLIVNALFSTYSFYWLQTTWIIIASAITGAVLLVTFVLNVVFLLASITLLVPILVHFYYYLDHPVQPIHKLIYPITLATFYYRYYTSLNFMDVSCVPRYMSVMNYASRPIRLIKAATVLHARSWEDVKSSKLKVVDQEKMRKISHKVLFVSHKWIGDKYDVDDLLLRQIAVNLKKIGHRLARIEYVWVDCICADQVDPTSDVYSIAPHIPSMVSMVFYNKDMKLDYLRSAWCNVELLSTLRTIGFYGRKHIEYSIFGSDEIGHRTFNSRDWELMLIVLLGDKPVWNYYLTFDIKSSGDSVYSELLLARICIEILKSIDEDHLPDDFKELRYRCYARWIDRICQITVEEGRTYLSDQKEIVEQLAKFDYLDDMRSFTEIGRLLLQPDAASI